MSDVQEDTACAAVLGGGAAFLRQTPASQNTVKKNRKTMQAGVTEQKAIKHDGDTGDDETDRANKREQRYYHTSRMETATARAPAGGGRFRIPSSRGRRTTSASYHTGVSKPATYSCRMETASGASRSERRRLHRSRSLRRVWCRRRLERGERSEPRRRDEPAEDRRGVVATWKSAAYRLERGGRCLQATPEPARGLTAGCNSPTVPLWGAPA